jgi:hypothetical protein
VDERVDDLSTAGEGAAGGMRPSSSAGVRCESSLKVDEVEFCAAAPAAARPLTAPIVGAQRAESVEVQLPTICAHEAKLEVTRAGPRAAEIDQGAVANASVSCDRAMINDLPVELLEHILLMLPAPALWSGWNRVCRHWSRVMMGCVPIKRRMQNERWLAYEARVIVPQVVLQADERVFALCAGPDIIVCSASSHHYTWRVWSDKSGALEALQIALRTRTMVAIGQHNQIYVWAHLCNIEVWSRSSGALLQTLVGHTGAVCALAVDRVHGNVYSGSADRTIRVWSGVDGTHLRTLVGHTDEVHALAIGGNGNVHSASSDRTIVVWSGENGSRLRTLAGHTSLVASLAVGRDGKVYSGSWDCTIRVWSPDDGALLKILEGRTHCVNAVAVGPGGELLSGSHDGTIKVWSGDNGALMHSVNVGGRVELLAVGASGAVFAGEAFSVLRMFRYY